MSNVQTEKDYEPISNDTKKLIIDYSKFLITVSIGMIALYGGLAKFSGDNTLSISAQVGFCALTFSIIYSFCTIFLLTFNLDISYKSMRKILILLILASSLAFPIGIIEVMNDFIKNTIWLTTILILIVTLTFLVLIICIAFLSDRSKTKRNQLK